MEIILYKNSAEKNRKNKTVFITQVGAISGTLREETSITNPILAIETENINFNYIYISEFKRYYYVNSFTSIRNGLWEIECYVDVLMSFSEAIGKLEGFIDRNEFEYDNFIIDDKLVVLSGYDYHFTVKENSFIKNDSESCFAINGFYILNPKE